MNTRLIIPLLVAGALAFACAPRSHSDAPASLVSALPVRSLAAQPTTRITKHSKAEPRIARVDSKLNVAVGAHTVDFALDVKNTGNKHVELSFPGGQAYDFAVVDSTGREVWRWSDRRMFTTGVQNKQLGSGESLRLSESWTPSAKPGHYTVIATLKSSNFPIEQRADIVLQ